MFRIVIRLHLYLKKAFFDINSLSFNKTSFGKRWVYKGVLKNFKNDTGNTNIEVPQNSLRNLPITVSIAYNPTSSRPLGNSSYCLYCRLIETTPGHYMLKVAKNTPWYPVADTWSFAEIRFRAKQAVEGFIREHIFGQRAVTFLTGITTGEFDDRLMAFEFSRFGLQHIMAISGFHFAIIATMLSGLLRFVCSKKVSTLVLIFLLSSYCLFLGSSPSILRAWITIIIALLSLLVERRGSGLNSLGIAMLVVLLLDPLASRQVGFQFSFVITAAILLFYGWVDEIMQQVLLKRPLSQVVQMDRWNQYGYCILAFFRQAMALAIAVNVIAVPLMLFHFQTFPLLGLIYNLFFPFLVSVAMLLLLLGLIFSFLPFIGEVFHYLNSHYTQWMLNLVYNIPVNFDVAWTVSPFSSELLIIYLTLLLFFGVILRYNLEKQKEGLQDFAFI